MPDPIKVSQMYDKYEVIPVYKVFERAVNSVLKVPKHLYLKIDLSEEKQPS